MATIGRPLALIVVLARITGRPELSTSATYVTAQAARRRRATAALRDPDSTRISAAYIMPRYTES